jgi:hypothetical protein
LGSHTPEESYASHGATRNYGFASWSSTAPSSAAPSIETIQFPAIQTMTKQPKRGGNARFERIQAHYDEKRKMMLEQETARSGGDQE